jgi:molybdate/tungstate transport system substrate-binding protein
MRFRLSMKKGDLTLAVLTILGCGMFVAGPVQAGAIDVFHADSLAGPMKALKAAFEAGNPGVTVNLVSGRSQELTERILNGDTCDVFAPSAPSAIDKGLVGKKVKGTDKEAAAWSVVFSANEMVLITGKGNPLGIRKVIDLAGEKVRFTRVTGEKDLATNRTVDFVRNVAALEGKPDLAQGIIDRAAVDPAKPHTVPQTIADVVSGKADAGVVYFSAAVAEKDKLEILRFPITVNLSSEIRNAATVPATAKDPATAVKFVRLLISDEGKALLEATGQPPVAPPIFNGNVPAELK